MSHIPNKAMPHAKPHTPEPAPREQGSGLTRLAVGGAIAAGIALAAAPFLAAGGKKKKKGKGKRKK